MIFDGTYSFDHDDAEESKLVFIGKNINKRALMAAFAECLYDEDAVEEERSNLRFGLGDMVKCKIGPRSWKKGKVTGLLEHDEDLMDPGYVAPYIVTMANGTTIFAPYDSDDIIRAAT